MKSRITVLQYSILLLFLFKSFHLVGQEYQTYTYTKGKNYASLGLSGGTFMISIDAALSLSLSRRVSEFLTLEISSVVGSSRLLYISESHRSPVHRYAGVKGGFLFGRKDKLFEFSLGLARFRNHDTQKDETTHHDLPIFTLAYRKTFIQNSIRIGVGFPHGFLFGVNFGFGKKSKLPN